MIQHHTGALMMVQDLFDTPGAGQDSLLFDFATDVDNTQRAEINIMQGMLKEKQRRRHMILSRTSRLSRRRLGHLAALSVTTLCARPSQHRRQPIRARRLRRSAHRTQGRVCTTPAKRRSAWSG